MDAVIGVGLGVAWWVSGYAGFLYWWTSEYDAETGDMVFAVFLGFLGPATWVIGRALHGSPKSSPRVWIRKRKR